MKIGFTASAFDLLHAGHIVMLKTAKEQCDYLICGLHIDPSKERQLKNKPIQSVVERYIQLKAVRYVNEVIPYECEKDLIDILTVMNIDVRILGDEYMGTQFSGYELDVENFFNTRRHRFSSSELRSRVKGVENG